MERIGLACEKQQKRLCGISCTAFRRLFCCGWLQSVQHAGEEHGGLLLPPGPVVAHIVPPIVCTHRQRFCLQRSLKGAGLGQEAVFVGALPAAEQERPGICRQLCGAYQTQIVCRAVAQGQIVCIAAKPAAGSVAAREAESAAKRSGRRR